MSLSSTLPPLVLTDGRQSARAFDIQRGVLRRLRDFGLAGVPELTLANGRRADLTAISDQGEVVMVEIKSSLADFQADSKWQDYLPFCDRFFFAVGADFPLAVLPEEPGLIIADRYGAEIMRESPIARLDAARRKAMLIRFGRAAAQRIHAAIDPERWEG
jgi:hypothetical protein